MIDKDLASAVLAEEIGADVFVMLTDGDAACIDYGLPTERSIRTASPEALAEIRFAEGSMQPKIDAAISFAKAGGRAFIGPLARMADILDRKVGTEVRADAIDGVEFYETSTQPQSA